MAGDPIVRARAGVEVLEEASFKADPDHVRRRILVALCGRRAPIEAVDFGRRIAETIQGTLHGLLVWPQPGRISLGHTGNMR